MQQSLPADSLSASRTAGESGTMFGQVDGRYENAQSDRMGYCRQRPCEACRYHQKSTASDLIALVQPIEDWVTLVLKRSYQCPQCFARATMTVEPKRHDGLTISRPCGVSGLNPIGMSNLSISNHIHADHFQYGKVHSNHL